MGSPTSAKLVLTEEERGELERLARGRSGKAAFYGRARIILKSSTGLNAIEVAEELGTTREKTAGIWRRSFLAKRLVGRYDEPRSGAPRKIDDDVVERASTPR